MTYEDFDYFIERLAGGFLYALQFSG